MSKFQYQLLVDDNVDLFLCRMVFLPQKYSKKTIEEPYRKLIPKQSNKILTNFIYPAFFETRANQKQCKKIIDNILNYKYFVYFQYNPLSNALIYNNTLPEELFANVFLQRRAHE